MIGVLVEAGTVCLAAVISMLAVESRRRAPLVEREADEAVAFFRSMGTHS